MRKKFEKDGTGNISSQALTKFEPGTETIILHSCQIKHETDKAWLIQPDGWPDETPHWIPKSVCIVHTHAQNKARHDFEILASFAKKEGLDE